MEHYFTNSNNLKSEFRTIVYKIENEELKFTSDLGVFSKDKVDFGSDLLIKTYIKNGKKDIKLLDVGCGYGIIGITLSKIMNTTSTMIDINKRAVHLTSMNIKNIECNCNVFESDGYSNVKDKYDVIMTNPPIRTGKENVKNFLVGAKSFLNESGELWFVMKKDHGVKSMIEILKEYYEIEIMEKSKGFYIVKCVIK